MVAPPLLLSVLSYGWRYPFALSSLIGCIGICLFIINLRDISSLSGGVVHYTTPPIQTVVTENPRGKLEEVSYGNDNGACACKELEVGDLNGKNNSPIRRSVRIQNKTVTVIPIEQQDMSTLHYNPDSNADGGATLTHRKKTVEFATPMLFKKRGSRVGMDSNRSSVTKQIDFGDDDQTTDVEEEGTDKTESSTIEIAPQSTNQIVMQCLLYNAEVQCICVAAMFSYFGLAMFIDWFAVYLTDACLQRMEITAGLVIWIEAGALSGAFACGITSDYLNGRRSLTALLFAMLGVPVLLLFPYTQLRAISLYHTAQPLESGSGLETMLHANSEAAQHMETVPYTVEGMHHQHSSAPLFVYYGVPLSTTWIYVIARGCLLVGGFAMNGPKTLLGMSIRACTPSVISGTIGGALGLIGQGGSYLGSRLLSSLLSQKHAFLVLSVIPIGVRMGMNQIGTILFEYSVLSPYLTSLSTLLNTPVNGFDLFPLLYSTCALLAVLFLAYPAYKEYHRIIKKHPVRKVKDI